MQPCEGVLSSITNYSYWHGNTTTWVWEWYRKCTLNGNVFCQAQPNLNVSCLASYLQNKMPQIESIKVSYFQSSNGSPNLICQIWNVISVKRTCRRTLFPFKYQLFSTTNQFNKTGKMQLKLADKNSDSTAFKIQSCVA